MAYAVWFKQGCETTIIAPSGVRILGALERCARNMLLHDLVITSGCDSHPPTDPHSKGQAFDVRTHDLNDQQKDALLSAVMHELSEGSDTDPLIAKDGGFVTTKFFGWIEHKGEANEHAHFQQRNGVMYP